MKKILLPFLSIVFTAAIFSQTPFEGKITHKITSELENQSGIIEIFYGKQKVRGIANDSDSERNNDITIFDFAKGLKYHINPLRKTYTIDSLDRKSPNNFSTSFIKTGKYKTISSHYCSAFAITDTIKDDNENMHFIFWYADSLYFPVNDQYINSSEIFAFTNGKNISMGMDLSMTSGEEKKILSITPVLVEPMLLPDSIFDIPNGYKLMRPSNIIMIDSSNTTIKVIDTQISEIKKGSPPPPPPPLPPFSKNKRKSKRKV